jgi:ATP-binding cassette subfamily B protein/subfamily B ATP-binding cassette protein MsbA
VNPSRPTDRTTLTTRRACVWLTGYAFRRWRSLLIVLLTIGLQVGISIVQPWPMKLVIDFALTDQPMPGWLSASFGRLPGVGEPRGLIVWAAALSVLFFLFKWAIGLIKAWANIGFGRRMVFDLAGDLFTHLQQLSMRFHHKAPTGDVIRRLTKDCDCVSVIVKSSLIPMLGSVFTLVTIFAVMWAMNPALSLLALGVVPLMALILWRLAKPIMNVGYAEQQAEARIYTTVEQQLSAVQLIQAFGQEDRAMQALQQDTREALQRALAHNRLQVLFKVLMGLVTAVGTAGLMWLGARQVQAGVLSVGDIVVFLAYLGSLYAPINALMQTASTIQSAMGSARRVREVLDTDIDVADAPDAEALPGRSRGALRFESVVFGYQPDRPVLDHVDLDIEPGQTVAIVGATGAGKSTLVGLVPRFYDPQQGRVLLDGRDLRSITLASLRRQVALVLQDAYLFPVSIAQNIAYARPNATEQQILDAARAANAHDFIAALPDGYDTVVGERGATLSGGERQRVSIARALLCDSPVLILDEPTSALDALTEDAVVQATHNLMAGRTTLIIAHRLSTVRHADHIVVMHQGKIVEHGTHQQLIEQYGRYADMVNKQMLVK